MEALASRQLAGAIATQPAILGGPIYDPKWPAGVFGYHLYDNMLAPYGKAISTSIHCLGLQASSPWWA